MRLADGREFVGRLLGSDEGVALVKRFDGEFPINTDGGGLCSNHPVNRGGMTKIIEAVRQLRGQAHPKVQVPNCDLAIAHGTGGLLGVRHAASTCILERV